MMDSRCSTPNDAMLTLKALAAAVDQIFMNDE